MLPRATVDRVQQVLEDDWGRNLIRSWDDRWIDLPRQLGDIIGTSLLGAGPGETIVGDSTTVALFKAISAALDARPGRNAVVIERDNFPTDRYVVESLAQHRGLEIRWVEEAWRLEVDPLVDQQSDPVAALIALARGHAVFCRRDVARVVIALRVEFSGQDHPVGREIERISAGGVKRCVRLINAGRRDGSIPPGPPARAVALAFGGALEGAVIALAGQAPHDELLAARAVAGVLGRSAPI
jgi:hypothetical protein